MERDRLTFAWLILSILLSIVLPSAHLLAQGPSDQAVIDLSFADLGFSDQTLTTARSERIYSLVVPRNLGLQEEDSYLELTLSHTAVVTESLATLNVTLNQTRLGAINLNQDNARKNALRFDLDASSLVSGRNQLSLQLDPGPQCNDLDTTLNVQVFDGSHFHLEYERVPFTPDLALYPLPFFESSFLPSTVYLVLPDAPSASDLSAAATISAGLGKLSDGELSLTPLRASQLISAIRRQHHLIVIGKRDANQVLDQLTLPLALNEQNLSEDQGVIEVLPSPWNPLRMVLVISGLSDDGVTKASLALDRENLILDMRGQFRIVEEIRPPTEEDSRPRAIDRTLSSLGYSDEVVCGTEPHALDFDFAFPLGWTTQEEPRFVLSFGHAQVVDPTRSALVVEFNGVPVGSALLDESNISDGRLETTLPTRLIEPGHNRVTVSVEMHHPEAENCLFIDSCQFSTSVNSDSYIHLPYISEDVPSSLELFPYPFNQNRNLEDLVIVLPDDPQSEDLDVMVRLATTFGANMRGDEMTVSATTAGDVTEAKRQEKHLIVLGLPLTNSLIQELNAWLPQSFQDGTNLLEPQLDSVIIVEDAERDAGLIEQLVSPWNSERTVLVLTGTTETGLSLAYETLLKRSSALSGNVAVVEALTGAIRAFDTRVFGEGQASQTQDEIDIDIALLSQLAERWW